MTLTWPSIAAAVLRGEYDKSDNSTRESILIGLRSSLDPDCIRAVALIKSMKPAKEYTA